MPEVPSNMQEGLANLELNALNTRMSSSSTTSSEQAPYVDQRNSKPQRPGLPGFTASYEHTNASAYQNINRDQYDGPRGEQDAPKFSPFPKLRNPAPNVPLSDEDKEDVLERARPLVLKSTDPEMQLAWAQDALSWVEVASSSASRDITDGQLGRPITPKVEHQLREDALSIVKFLADQHHPKAEFMKGMWLEFGKFGFRIERKEAFMAYKRAAEKVYARAEYRIGMQYENSNNNQKAIEHYQKGAALQDSASRYRLGMMTLLGQHGMPQDYQRGIDLVRLAAETADENAPQGAYVYGMLLARELPNINVPEQFLPFDMNDAKLFIEKAAYLGFAKAQAKMGQAYELCSLGCDFDPALSLHYNALAARQGDAEAQMAISKWFLCGCDGVFEKNEELAFAYAKQAAASKLPTAEFAMGYFYEVGIHVQKDLRESEAWYQKAADHGNNDAVGRIESIRKNNTLSRKDHEQTAITRIKSQYGSQRGQRPERFKQKPAPMQSMEEETTEMPDPRNSYGNAAAAAPRRVSPSGRPASTAPYPDDDGPPIPGAYNSGGLRPNSGSGPQADRPSSAFGVRPLVHSSTETMNQGLRPQEARRPNSSQGNMAVPGSRDNSPDGRGRVVSAGWVPQVPANFRQPSPNHQRLPSLNVDSSGYGQKPLPSPNLNKPQPSPNLNKPQPSPGGYGRASPQPAGFPPQPAGYNSPIQRREPSANYVQRPERGSSMTPTAGTPTLQQRPDRFDSMPPPQQPNRANQRPPQQTMSSQGNGSRPSPVPSAQGSGRPSSGTPSAGAASNASAPSAPPKKQGPSTFEEMGIPPQKKDGDCVNLPCSNSICLLTINRLLCDSFPFKNVR
jgi:TPR repeat protein